MKKKIEAETVKNPEECGECEAVEDKEHPGNYTCSCGK
jgi:hypothetical protein